MKSFSGVDYYATEGLLSGEELTQRDKVRHWVDTRYMPQVGDDFEQGRFDRSIVPELAQLGVLGVKINGYGGRSQSNMVYGLICQELERGDTGLRSFVSVQNSLVMYPIDAFGTEAQKARWLPAMARGEKIGCFGLTEYATGSDPQHLQTRAVRDGHDYVISGSKMWITNGAIADVAIIWARTDDGIRGFLVEKGTPGFQTADIPGKFSVRASVTSGLLLKNVRVSQESLLPGTLGLKSALQCLNQARYGIAWGAVGAAMACYAIALDFAKNRVQFQAPIASYQLVQRKLVKMLTEITKAQLLCIQLGRLMDQGIARHPQISMAKRNNVAEALKIARTARSILGARGITLDHHVIRHLLNLETVYTYEGTHDIHTLILGQDITGHSAFSTKSGKPE